MTLETLVPNIKHNAHEYISGMGSQAIFCKTEYNYYKLQFNKNSNYYRYVIVIQWLKFLGSVGQWQQTQT